MRSARYRSAASKIDELLAAGQVPGDPAFDPRYERIAQPNVGEGAANHDLVVASAGPEGVEVAPLDALLY